MQFLIFYLNQMSLDPPCPWDHLSCEENAAFLDQCLKLYQSSTSLLCPNILDSSVKKLLPIVPKNVQPTTYKVGRCCGLQ